MVIGMRAPSQMVASLPGMTTSQFSRSCVPSGKVTGLATKPCTQEVRSIPSVAVAVAEMLAAAQRPRPTEVPSAQNSSLEGV